MLSKQEEMREREETMRQDADWQRQLKEAAKAKGKPSVAPVKKREK